LWDERERDLNVTAGVDVVTKQKCLLFCCKFLSNLNHDEK
jgi:hypothetical protein